MELDEQLVDMEPEGKELPQRPESNDLQDVLGAQVAEHEYSNPFASAMEMNYEDEPSIRPTYPVQESARAHPPTSRASPSLFVDTSRDARDGQGSYLTQQYSLQSAFSRARYNNSSTLRPPMDNAYMPPPLSPLRPLSPARPPPAPIEEEESLRKPVHPEIHRSNGQLASDTVASGHRRENSHESVSWLDPIDESERSSVSSVHSRSSSRIRRKHVRVASGATEAEFDAALDDAIEAAYDDGYEPESQYVGQVYQGDPMDPMANTLRRVEMAREMVRESEREALELANEREKRLRQQQQLEDEEYRKQEAIEDFYDGNDSEEEERFLEEMTKGNAIEDFAFGARSRPPVPRESDSSGTTSRTWHSSMGSNPPTSTTLLTPVSENSVHPHPTGPLPALPTHAAPPLPPPPHSAGSQSSGQSVRNRRLSGQNAKELKIETAKLTPMAPPATAGAAIPSHPKSGNYILQQRQALSAGPNRTVGPFSSRITPSPVPPALENDDEEADPVPPMEFGQDDHSRVGTPSVVRPNLKKNFSASSLKSLKTRNLSISHLDETAEFSPGTPSTNQFGIGGSYSRLPAVPSLPAAHAQATKDRTNSTATSGLHLFENHFHSFDRPGSPNSALPDAPASLEPCPNDTM
jgi:hypothetical protein